MAKFFNKTIKISIYSLVFLLPLFWLPFSFESFEFNKQYLLFFLVSLSFLSWIAKMVISDKEIRFRRTPLDIPVLVFMFISILSAAFSIDKTSSFFGFYGRFSDNLVGILTLGVLYFLITNNTKTNQDTDKGILNIGGILKAFSWSVFTVILFTFFSLFGVWQMLFRSLNIVNFVPGAMLSRIFNPIGGSLEGLSIFLTVAIVLFVVLLLMKIKNKESIKKLFFYYFLIFTSLFLLIIIDFTLAWLILALTLILFLVFAFWSRIFRAKVNSLLIPITLLIISICCLFIKVSNFIPPVQVLNYSILNSPKEVLLDQPTSWQVTWQTIKSYPALGSGIGTFAEDFTKFKPLKFNQTDFWQIRFDKAGSQFAEIIATTGVFGVLSWLSLIVLFLMIGWFVLKNQIRKEANLNEYQLPLLFVFSSLVISQFIYYQNTTLAFLFWLSLGLGVMSWQTPVREKKASFKDFPEMNLAFNIVLVVIILIIFGTWFMAGKFYFADIKYKEGVFLGKLDGSIRAVNLNKARATYSIGLSRAYFIEAANELKRATNEQDAQKIQTNFALSINEARRASQISPKWVAVFENLGMVYRDIRGFAQGASNWANDSFLKALALEPTNPVFPVEIGKLFRDDKKLTEAKKEFEKALALKPDYLDAKIQLALLAEQEGNRTEAISKLKEIVEENPLSVDVAFQLGRLYYNNEQIDEAINQFKRALSIFPNHSNSLYALGIAYQKKGMINESLEVFKKVLELNPGNNDVIQKINELERPREEIKKK